MSLRRYVNLVTESGHQGIHSLRRLNADNFFFPADEAAGKARDLPRLRRVKPPDVHSWIAQKKKKHAAALSGQQQLEPTIRSPPPMFSLRPTNGNRPELHFFPLSGTKVFFADCGKRTTLYDTEARCAITTPNLHAPKYYPVALSVPGPGTEGEEDSHSLYIMDTSLDSWNATPFEALICRRPAANTFAKKTWHCDALPPPPFFSHPREMYKSVLSYALVGDLICVSLTIGGTYCFDTVTRTWSLAGDWQMPFSGKAEYDPELKLWFGVSVDNHQLPCAADLSPILGGRAPKKHPRYIWANPYVPEDYFPDLYYPANIVSLGSGRFCIVNFFRNMEGLSSSWEDELSDTDGMPVVLISGLEVLACNGNGNATTKTKIAAARAVAKKAAATATSKIAAATARGSV
ncbi:hypothetical protein QYE76_059653 [Lolium multiflorum]|uniref:Uncharacterized protein n=1 Tax=Lolium multiflorum TaxID=4521 RepID=A0AAD8RZ29_LOLMU|nr:hypothetical protein QYE76_059653 [Lolium multiflorum]